MKNENLFPSQIQKNLFFILSLSSPLIPLSFPSSSPLLPLSFPPIFLKSHPPHFPYFSNPSHILPTQTPQRSNPPLFPSNLF